MNYYDREHYYLNVDWGFPWDLTPVRWKRRADCDEEDFEHSLKERTGGLYQGVSSSWAHLTARPSRNYICREALPSELRLIKSKDEDSNRGIVVVARVSNGPWVLVYNGDGGHEVKGPCFFQIVTACHHDIDDSFIRSWGEQASEALFGLLINQGRTAPDASFYSGIIRVLPFQRFVIEW